MSKQNICSDTHEEIVYNGDECPLCRERLLLDKLLDDRTDVDQTNILELFRQQRKLERRVRTLEMQVDHTKSHPISADLWSMAEQEGNL